MFHFRRWIARQRPRPNKRPGKRPARQPKRRKKTTPPPALVVLLALADSGDPPARRVPSRREEPPPKLVLGRDGQLGVERPAWNPALTPGMEDALAWTGAVLIPLAWLVILARHWRARRLKSGGSAFWNGVGRVLFGHSVFGNWLLGAPGARGGAPAWAATGGDLDAAFLDLGDGDVLTVRDACSGLMVVGPSGSGKTSGPLRAVAFSALKKGFCTVFFAVKSDDARNYVAWCKKAGRKYRLFGPGHALRLDPLAGAGGVQNVVALLLVLGSFQHGQGGAAAASEAFWEEMKRVWAANAAETLVLAGMPLSFVVLKRLVDSAPMSSEQMKDPDFLARSLWNRAMAEANQRCARAGGAAQERFAELAEAWLSWVTLAPQTRSGIHAGLTGIWDPFCRPGPLRDLFGNGSTFSLRQMMERQEVLIVDAAVKTQFETGRLVNVTMKYLLQREIERRRVDEETPPVVLIQDEYQYLAFKEDLPFQDTARSQRCITTCAFQTPNSLYARFPGDSGRALADTIMTNLSNRFFLAMSARDAVFAAELIGKVLTEFDSGSAQMGERDPSPWALLGGQAHHSAGWNTQYEFQVQPADFQRLRRGGPRNDYQVDTLYVRGGDPLPSNDANVKVVTFDQRG